MGERRRMQPNDWGNAAINMVIGVFLGLAVHGMTQLVTTAFWPLVVIIPILFGGLFLFAQVFDGLIDRVFPGGVEPARNPKTKGRKPLALLLSLPVGMVLGVIMALFGLGDLIL